MTNQKSNSKLIEGLLLGTALGTMIGFLVSPRNGKENRQAIQKSLENLPISTQEFTNNFQLRTKLLARMTTRQWHDTIERLQIAISAGIEASQKEK